MKQIDPTRPFARAPLLLLTLAACAAPPPVIERAYWHPVDTGSKASLRGLHAVDANVVWAAGSAGTVLRTTDGGNSWSHLHAGDGLELRDVHAFDAETAYVLSVTEPASVLRTRDGGASWEELYRSPHPEAFLDSFTFLDRRRAILFGDPIEGRFLILWTDDGGASWQPAASAPGAEQGEAAFAASGTCVVSAGEGAWIGTGGLASRVLRSLDGGRTWKQARSNMTFGQPTTGIYSLAFRDAQRGVAVGGDYTAPERAERNAAYTTDGGVTWFSAAADALPRGQRAAAAWVPEHANTVLAVGRTGTDVSVDGGRTWAALSEVGFYALSFAPSGEGWAVGADGRAARLVVPAPDGAAR